MKLGVNKPCHCGSGIKYKKCCKHKDDHPEPTPKSAKTERKAGARAIKRARIAALMAILENDLSKL